MEAQPIQPAPSAAARAENRRDPLRPREEDLRDFLENAAAAMHWVGPDGTILWANRAELEMLGYARDEYVGHHIAEFHADRPVIEDILARLWRNETLRNYEARLRDKDGAIRHVLIDSSVCWRDGEFIHTRCFTRDITARRREEERRRLAESYLTAQYAVTRVLAEAESLSEAMPRVLQAVCETADWTLGAAWTVDEGAQVVRCVDVWSVPDGGAGLEAFAAATRSASFGPGVGLPGRVWASASPAWLADVVADDNFPRSPFAVRAGLHGGFAFPIRIRDRVTGVVEFLSREVREPDPHVLQLFETLGAHIGQFIERREVERALRDSEERYRRLVSLLPAAVYTCSAPLGVITFYNERAAQLWGRAPAPGDRDERFCGSLKLYRPDGRALAHAETPMAVAVREGRSFRDQEVVLERPDGTRITVLANIDPIRDERGALLGAINVFHDMTALKQAQSETAQSEERFRTLVSVITDVPWITDEAGAFVEPQPAWSAFTGQSWEELRGFGWLAALHPDDRETVKTLWVRACRSGTLYESKGRLWHGPTGQWRFFEARATPRLDAAGHVIEWVGTCTDVTARKAAEDERQRLLAEAQQHAWTTEKLNSIGALVASGFDREAIVQSVTDAATALTTAEFGAFFYNVTEPESGEAYLLYTLSGAPKEVFARFPKPRATALFGPTFRGEGIVRLDDVTRDPRFGLNAPYQGLPEGHLPVRSYLAVPVKGRAGDVLGGLFFGHSQPGVFTQQHEVLADGIASWASIALENARLYAAAEEAVRVRDEFLSIASHELRNPINALQLQLVGLLRAARARGVSLPTAWVCDRAGQAVDDVARLVRLVDNLLDVSQIASGRLHLEPEDVELSALVEGVVKRFDAQLRGVTVTLQMKDAAGRWDRLRLDQVVTNLVSNAIKYGEGQPIEIALDADADRAYLTVTDHGIGMDAEQQKQLFERFRRTVSRRQYGGFGLGLWITRRIVHAMHGEIVVESRPGEGSTFRVALPRR